jgi:hypothetical protein
MRAFPSTKFGKRIEVAKPLWRMNATTLKREEKNAKNEDKKSSCKTLQSYTNWEGEHHSG